MWPWAGELSKILEFHFNISATVETSDFKFGTQLGFDKSYHKITPRGKSWRGPGLGKFLKISGPELGELTKIWGAAFIIYAIAKSIDFKFGTGAQFEWAIRPIIKSHK